MELGSACPTPGNMTQICVERCAEDGVTCDTEMELDMCSCKGRTLSTRETIQFDMERYNMCYDEIRLYGSKKRIWLAG